LLSNIKLYDNKIINNSLNIYTFPNITDKIITKNYIQTISNKITQLQNNLTSENELLAKANTCLNDIEFN
jgi:hypothetical protein